MQRSTPADIAAALRALADGHAAFDVDAIAMLRQAADLLDDTPGPRPEPTPPVYVAAENYRQAQLIAREANASAFWFLPDVDALRGRRGGTLLAPVIAESDRVAAVVGSAAVHGMTVQRVAW
jgi:hypothetical protein